MKWEKAALIVFIAYLAIALPLYLLNSEAVGECKTACEQEGFDIVSSAVQTEKGIECGCLSSFTRTGKTLFVEQA